MNISFDLPEIEWGDDAASGAEPPHDGDSKPVNFTPTAFQWRDPATIPRREFLYGNRYIRGFVSATVAPGGVGKSSVALVEVVAMAAGRDLLGSAPSAPLKVWYVNLEDPRVEIERRVAAICSFFGITPSELGGRLFYDGRETEVVVASQTKAGAVVATPVVEGLTTALKDGRFDVFSLDPFVSAHRCTENDNNAIDMVAKTFGRIAGAANCAIELVHHTRKTGGAEITAEDGRGASAMSAAARSVRVLNPMSKDEAAKAGVEGRRGYFRMEIDKSNMTAPADQADWYRIVSVDLPNGDSVGVATQWKWPDAFEGMTVNDLRKAQASIATGGPWRENAQAKDWAGVAIARALGLDATNKAHKAKITAMLKMWIANGMFVVVEGLDDQRRPRAFIEVGDAAND
jgi:hypothetical protein